MKSKSTVFALAVFLLLVLPAPAGASFGIKSFSLVAHNADGTVDQLAASHPDSLDVHLAVNSDSAGDPEGRLQAIRVDLPSGLTGNAARIGYCPFSEFERGPFCSGATQIGVLRGIIAGTGQLTVPVYNLNPPMGYAAEFGASINGIKLVQRLRLLGVGEESSIRLSGALPPNLAIVDVEEEIWGVPAAGSHDAERVCSTPEDELIEGCASAAEERPFITLPAVCGEPMRASLTAISADPIPLSATATGLSRDSGGNPAGLIGCESVPFDPQLSVGTESKALTPSRVSIGLEVPQHEAAEVTSAATIRDVDMTLPPGVALNPSSASWMSSCVVREDASPVSCPAGARIGTVRVRTPLIDHELEGAVYLDPPDPGALASRLGIHLVIDDEASGTLLKIPGRIEADPGEGRLTVTVSDLPRFPFSQVEIAFSGGPRAPLTSPPSCGSYWSSATFTPSTAPYSPAVDRGTRFTLTAGPDDSACPPAETDRNPAPAFHAGVVSPASGGDSPLLLSFSREDLDQHFGSFDLNLPPGLLANLGTTPVGAAVGSVEVKAGLGPQPLSLSGTAYLGGPYRGAPYSLDFVVPAKAGPIDLGTISLRAAVDVDPATARVSVRSDPLPQILDGVPLELRSLRVDLDRPGFIRNPTSCEPTAIAGTATTSLGQVAPISDRFQVGDCAALAFRPKLSLRLSGAIGRNGHPALRAVLQGGADEAAVSGLGFTLPAGELLDLGHVRALCRPGVASERCPRGSQLGRLRLRTPFLDEPLSGPIQLRTPSRRLPDLTADLRSARFQVTLHGRATSRHGRLGIRFAGLPDIPISKAVLDLPGGRRGIVVNSRGLCKAGPAVARFDAHSGKQRRQRVRVRLGRRC